MVFEKRVSGIEPLTLLDYSGRLSAILFYYGCNFICPYCYNCDIVENKRETLDAQELIDFAKSRRGKLDAFVFSGGECTLHGDRLMEDMEFIRSLGYEIKLDSNGSRPSFIQELIKRNLIDYVAMDFKSPSYKFDIIARSSHAYERFLDSFDILLNSGIPFELRTTIHPDITNEDDINHMIQLLEVLRYKGSYYLQFFFKTERTLGQVSQNPRPFDLSKLVLPKSFKIELRNDEGNTVGCLA